jgi:hypothetical protein
MTKALTISIFGAAFLLPGCGSSTNDGPMTPNKLAQQIVAKESRGSNPVTSALCDPQQASADGAGVYECSLYHEAGESWVNVTVTHGGQWAIAAAAAGSNAQPGTTTTAPTGVDVQNVKLGMTKREVINKLGAPAGQETGSRVDETNPNSATIPLILEYQVGDPQGGKYWMWFTANSDSGRLYYAGSGTAGVNWSVGGSNQSP